MYEQALFDTTEHQPGPGGPTYGGFEPLVTV